MRLLRLYRGGKLRFHHMSNRKPLLPRLQDSQSGECRVTSPRLFCFRSGDARVNEHPGLAAMHTIWLRQHNSIAQKLAFMNPQWSEVSLVCSQRLINLTKKQILIVFFLNRKQRSKKPEKLWLRSYSI